MPEFRLSERAERDLIEIYDYTEQAFGSYHADAYHAGLARIFDLLAHFPRIGREANGITPGIRRFRFQRHLIFYTEERAYVLIRAVLHEAREINADLFKGAAAAHARGALDIATHGGAAPQPQRATAPPAATNRECWK